MDTPSISANMIGALDTAMRTRTGEGLYAEQREALLDPARADEASGMLDDMQARMGVPADIIAPLRRLLTLAAEHQHPAGETRLIG